MIVVSRRCNEIMEYAMASKIRISRRSFCVATADLDFTLKYSRIGHWSIWGVTSDCTIRVDFEIRFNWKIRQGNQKGCDWGILFCDVHFCATLHHGGDRDMLMEFSFRLIISINSIEMAAKKRTKSVYHQLLLVILSDEWSDLTSLETRAVVKRWVRRGLVWLSVLWLSRTGLRTSVPRWK
jgi:hypothetical protein